MKSENIALSAPAAVIVASKWFRVAFSTTTIAPNGMPNFTYMPTQINPDSIEYTAAVQAHDVAAAVANIEYFWPGATPLYATPTEHADTFVDRSMLLVPMGYLPPPPPPPRKRGAFVRLYLWAFGEGPIFPKKK